MLKDNSICLFEVPNFDKIKYEYLYNEFIPDHLFYFTKSTFRTLLEFSGYEILNVNTIWDDYIISIHAKPKTKINWRKFDNNKEKMRQQILNFFKNTDKEFNAVWSAGHQSLTTISTLKLQNTINKIIDSATFKQYKFSPGSGIEIIDPNLIRKLKLKKILLMAAGFNKEIYSQLINKYSFKGEIAMLENGTLIKF